MAKKANEPTDTTPDVPPAGRVSDATAPKRKEREAAQRRPLVATSKEDSRRC